MNMFYYVLCYPRLTWDFSSKIFSSRFLRNLHTFIVNPLIILLFLHHIPKRLFHQVRYFIKWIFFSLMIEYIGHRFFRMIYFMRGWNLAWSAVLYGNMYFLSFLVRKHPLLTYFISFLFTAFLLFFFQIPIIPNLKNNWAIAKEIYRSNYFVQGIVGVCSFLLLLFIMW